MLLFLLLQTMQAVEVTCSGDHYNDIVLLDRYLDKQGIQHTFGASGQFRIPFGCDETIARKALDGFQTEFNIRCSKGWPSTLVTEARTTYTVLGPTDGGSGSWDVFAQESLMRRGFNWLVKHQAAKSTDEFVRCTYSLRPWLTEGGQRTETIDASLTLRSQGRIHTIHFVYDP